MYIFKHTPGPWKDKLDININYFFVEYPDCLDKQVHEANKKLAMAGPEMLKALIDIYKAQFYKNASLASLNSTIKKSVKVIEEATSVKIKEIIDGSK